MRWVRVIGLGLLLAATQASVAEAQDPYSCLDELEEAELDARLALVDQRLQAHKLGARLWWYGWQSFFGAVVGYQIFETTRSEPGTARRWASIIGTVGASLATIQMWILPLPAAYAPQRYRRMPTRTRQQREAKLRYGLESIETSATRESLARGPGAHALPIVWSATWATTLSLKFDSPGRTAFLVVGGFVITQARIWTGPQRAIGDWDQIRTTICQHEYTRGPRDRHRRRREEAAVDAELEALPPLTHRQRGPRVSFGVMGAGAQLFVSF